MNIKRSIQSHFRGWLPKGHVSTNAPQTAASLLRKHPLAIGFGVGMGIPEGIQWTLYFLDTYSDQGRFFTAQLIIIPLFAALIAVGYWLNMKAKKKHIGGILNNPSTTNYGWLPKEPTLQVHQTAVDPKNSLMVRWMARAIVLGTLASALLAILGSELGLTRGAGGYIWSLFAVAVCPIAVTAAAFFAKRREAQQRRTIK